MYWDCPPFPACPHTSKLDKGFPEVSTQVNVKLSTGFSRYRLKTVRQFANETFFILINWRKEYGILLPNVKKHLSTFGAILLPSNLFSIERMQSQNKFKLEIL